jgi:hypothetical protein
MYRHQKSALIAVGFLTVAMAGLAPASTVVFATKSTTLYEITDFSHWTATPVGSTFSVTMSDIAIDNSGTNLYGIDLFGAPGLKSELYSIDQGTGAITGIGSTGVSGLAGLAISSSGTMFASDLLNADIYTINTTTGVATVLGTNSGFSGAGDLEFVGNTLYLAGVSSGKDYLYTVDTTTGTATQVSAGNGICTGAGNQGTCYKGVDGLAFVNGVMEGFTSGGLVLDISTVTGLVTGTHSAAPGFNGATEYSGGFDAPTVPEPGVLSTTLLGLTAGAFALRKRRTFNRFKSNKA